MQLRSEEVKGPKCRQTGVRRTEEFEKKMQIPYDLAISCLNIYPREMKASGQRLVYKFIAALFIIVPKLEKNPDSHLWVNGQANSGTYTNEILLSNEKNKMW